MMFRHSRPGYVFLISVLAVGAVVTLIVSVLLLLATTVTRSTISLEQPARAFAYANTCAERTLRALRTDTEYAGGLSMSFSLGTCSATEISGVGNADRSFCATATSGTVTRIFQIELNQLLPRILIRSWREVAACGISL